MGKYLKLCCFFCRWCGLGGGFGRKVNKKGCFEIEAAFLVKVKVLKVIYFWIP